MVSVDDFGCTSFSLTEIQKIPEVPREWGALKHILGKDVHLEPLKTHLSE